MASTTLTPEQRRIRARVGAFALHASGGTTPLPARARSSKRFVREVDQAAAEARGESLTPEEVQRRAALARRGYFARLALASSRARSRKAGAGGSDTPRPADGGVDDGNNPTRRV